MNSFYLYNCPLTLIIFFKNSLKNRVKIENVFSLFFPTASCVYPAIWSGWKLQLWICHYYLVLPLKWISIIDLSQNASCFKQKESLWFIIHGGLKRETRIDPCTVHCLFTLANFQQDWCLKACLLSKNSFVLTLQKEAQISLHFFNAPECLFPHHLGFGIMESNVTGGFSRACLEHVLVFFYDSNLHGQLFLMRKYLKSWRTPWFWERNNVKVPTSSYVLYATHISIPQELGFARPWPST